MHVILVSLIFLLCAATAVRADFVTALAAYDAGDYAIAFSEWHLLAKKGDPDAQVALAGLYETGFGAPQNYLAAAHWYRKAADHGHRVARINLGELYTRGRGVERDIVRAWYWFALAAADGSTWSRDRQAEIVSLMTAPQRRRAHAMLEAARSKQ